jgi:hypothetical protein
MQMKKVTGESNWDVYSARYSLVIGTEQGLPKYCLSVWMTYKTGFWIGWLDLLTPYTHHWELQAIQRYRYLHTLQFTIIHTLGFSVFSSRILATDLYRSHCHFKSHMKFSLHSLIHFLSYHLRLPSPEFHPILDNNWLKWSLLQVNSLNFWQQLTAPLELPVI